MLLSTPTAVALLLCGLVLQVGAGAGATSPVARRVCHPDGLAQDPPVCYTADDADGPRHLPNVFGGPATLGQCRFGHPGGSSGAMSGGHSCWTGSLFGRVPSHTLALRPRPTSNDGRTLQCPHTHRPPTHTWTARQPNRPPANWPALPLVCPLARRPAVHTLSPLPTQCSRFSGVDGPTMTSTQFVGFLKPDF